MGNTTIFVRGKELAIVSHIYNKVLKNKDSQNISIIVIWINFVESTTLPKAMPITTNIIPTTTMNTVTTRTTTKTMTPTEAATTVLSTGTGTGITTKRTGKHF